MRLRDNMCCEVVRGLCEGVGLFVSLILTMVGDVIVRG